MKTSSISQFVFAFIAGMIAVPGFAPYGIFPLPLFSLVALFWLWQRAATPRVSGWLGFCYGLGLFGAGISWIYVALHQFGDMAPPLAALATFLFVSLIAAFPALAGYVQARLPAENWIKLCLVLPALWVAEELLRGYLMTGFPWLALGYSQVPDSPLAGFAPLLGVYGVSLLLAVSAGLLLLLLQQRWSTQGKIALAVLLAIWLGGAALRTMVWSVPQGEPVKVSLLQGNISEEDKFRDDQLIATLETYRRLIQSSDARLIVMPETAIPLLRGQIPDAYISALRTHMQQNNGDVLLGAFENEQERYYNSMFSAGVSASQHYRKNHLVPFGEFIPLRGIFGWVVNDLLNIPMSDLSSGGEQQPLLELAGQKIAMNICYEDAFGEEIIRALPQATLLLNTSNDAWYGDSAAAAQHNQLSQMRALETGRMMLRATNTGMTSVIAPDGHIRQILPQHVEGVLTAQVQGYSGTTPYVRWGNWAIAFILLAMAALAYGMHRKSSPRPLA